MGKKSKKLEIRRYLAVFAVFFHKEVPEGLLGYKNMIFKPRIFPKYAGAIPDPPATLLKSKNELK